MNFFFYNPNIFLDMSFENICLSLASVGIKELSATDYSKTKV